MCYNIEMRSRAETSIYASNDIPEGTAHGIFAIFQEAFGDRTEFDCTLNHISSHVAVRKVGGSVVSFAMLAQHGKEDLTLAFIATDPTVQKQGHGKAILGVVEALAKREGIKQITVDIAPDNYKARAMMARWGAREVDGVIPHFVKPVTQLNR